MLADAIRSETYRLFKNRTILFWSAFFVPIAVVLISLPIAIATKSKMDAMRAKLSASITAPEAADLGQGLLSDLSQLANPALLAFVLVGAATVYAGDYRWETWRLISARNSRPNLILGKVATVIGLTLVALLASVIAGTVGSLLQAFINGQGITFTMSGEQAVHLLLLFGLGLVRTVQFVMISLLAATVTRSLLAALFIPLVIGIGQFFLGQLGPIIGIEPGSWTRYLLLPAQATDTLSALIQGGTAANVQPPQALLKAIVGLGLWLLAPLALAIALFQRQGLSKE